ncbi:hypothetical protein NL108_009924 [Boleophthalmus pectinirostris]|nr:hypothetical protein NL108_009924 [Boleophthalmus pectinirostris]
MYSSYQYHEQLEDDLYREEEDDSEGSEADSELEFHLYSQLHYSSNAGEVSELEDERKERDEEKKRTKHAKNEKRKGQRASTVFEEVIVIDSSPDVITLSEDDSSDETEGVCALKGRGLPKLCTSTPAQQVKSESDSESESQAQSPSVLGSSSSSDSDDLENWMILGCGQQEGDQSISLNLDGVAESETGAQISNKAKGVRTIVPRVTSRYYTDKNVHCKNCNRTGHLSKNCPEPKKVSPCILCGTVGHIQSGCPYKHCNNCGLPGHLYSSCCERSYWHKHCHRCEMTGHFHDDCPEVWRQYHITVSILLQRMFNGTYPSTPFINHYDTTKDINVRQSRIEKKVKGKLLKKHIIYRPPRKKQKTTFEKNNYHHKKTPRQSYKTDLPASSHIFFSDTSDSISKPSKQQKHKPVSQEKLWKPKRPVPQSRGSVEKIVLDEADEFPRGGGQGEEMERRKKSKKFKKNGQSLCWTGASKQAKNNNVNPSKRKKKKNANKNMSDKMYPTDENLFIIKQRKHKRKD